MSPTPKRAPRGGALKGLLCVAAVLALAGCASTPSNPRDPLEPFNRSMFAFNEKFDAALAKPVAQAYQKTIPTPVRGWVRNFFSNIADVFIGVNDLLEGRPKDAITDWARFGFNTTFGIFGFNDVASQMGLEKHNGDFGLTFGTWGIGPGAYIVWPILGPSDVRDSFGTVLDWHFDPVASISPTGARNAAVLLRATSERADLLQASQLLEEAALDKYVFTRDAYLQHRRSLIYHGNPPRQRPPSHERDAQPHAAAPSQTRASGVRVAPKPRIFGVYEPRVPAHYEAVLAASRGR